MLDSILGAEHYVNTIVNANNPKGRSDEEHLPTAHEYIHFYAFPEAKSLGWHPSENVLRRYRHTDKDGNKFREIDLRKTGDNDLREDRPNLFYYFYYHAKTGELIPAKEKLSLKGYQEIIPLRADGKEGNWRWDIETAKKRLDLLIPKLMLIRGVWTVFEKDIFMPNERVIPTSVWTKKEFNSERGTERFVNLGFNKKDYPRPKPVGLLEHIFLTSADKFDLVLDFFAGSGTSAEAVINLNRDDEGKRKYILVEMGDYFDTVLKPRLKKVIYSKDWKDGKPISREGSSHMFKYIRLESYEDTLNNLELKRTEAQQSLLDQSDSLRESYILSYMLDVESKGSESLLNLNTFEDPFNYKLNISTGSAGETRPATIDLVETFNYLIGLTVNHIDSIRGFRVIQGTSPKGEKVLVIWRNLKEKSNKVLDEFFRKQEYNPKDMEFDLIYVNGDNNLENLRREDETWKVRLIEEDFKRLMFDVQDV